MCYYFLQFSKLTQTMAEDYDALCLKSPPKDDVLNAKISCSKRDQVDFLVSAKQERGIVLAVSAVKWSYPARASLFHLQNLEKESKKQKQQTSVRCFLIDQEKDRLFCKQHSVMVGIPTLQAWHESEPIYFARNGLSTSQIVHGPFNHDQYLRIIKLINRAIKGAEKSQQPLQEIDVDFLDGK